MRRKESTHRKTFTLATEPKPFTLSKQQSDDAVRHSEATRNQCQMSHQSPEDIPLVEILRLCESNPTEALEIVAQLPNDDQDFEWIVLARFRALTTLAIKPFVDSNVPILSAPNELIAASQSNTKDLCERALLELKKIEDAEIDLAYLKQHHFQELDEQTHDKQMADSICMLLEALCPTRVQQIRGATKLKYLGPYRIGVPALAIDAQLGHQAVQSTFDVLFRFPMLVGSVLPISTVILPNGSRAVQAHIFSQITTSKFTSYPGSVIGSLTLAEDGTYSSNIFPTRNASHDLNSAHLGHSPINFRSSSPANAEFNAPAKSNSINSNATLLSKPAQIALLLVTLFLVLLFLGDVMLSLAKRYSLGKANVIPQSNSADASQYPPAVHTHSSEYSVSKPPSESEIRAYLSSKIPSGTSIASLELLNMATEYGGRISGKGLIVLSDDLYIHNSNTLLNALTSSGWLKRDLRYLSDMLRQIRPADATIPKLLEVSSRKGDQTEFRFELFSSRVVDGWAFTGQLDIGKPFQGYPLSRARSLYGNIVVFGSDESNRLIADANTGRQEFLLPRSNLVGLLNSFFEARHYACSYRRKPGIPFKLERLSSVQWEDSALDLQMTGVMRARFMWNPPKTEVLMNHRIGPDGAEVKVLFRVFRVDGNRFEADCHIAAPDPNEPGSFYTSMNSSPWNGSGFSNERHGDINISALSLDGVVSSAAATGGDLLPAGEVVVANGRTLEGFQLGVWIASEAVPLFTEPNGTIQRTVSIGESVNALSTEVRSFPKRAVVTSTYKTDRDHGITVGSVVYVLYPIGEGAFAVWYNGKVILGSLDLGLQFDDSDSSKPLQWTLWARVRLSDGSCGWLKSPEEHFSGLSRHD